MASRVLIIEDVASVRAAVTSALRNQGFVVAACDSKADLAQALTKVAPEVVVLDPVGRSDPELTQRVRRNSRAAILLLAGRTAPETETRAADDFLRRPFTMVDLITRVRALARRQPAPPADVVIADLTISADLSRIERAGQLIDLTRTERRLLGFLAARAGEVIAKGEILTGVWGGSAADPNVVEVNISTIRRKLESHGPRIVHTVRGKGYRLGE